MVPAQIQKDMAGKEVGGRLPLFIHLGLCDALHPLRLPTAVQVKHIDQSMHYP